MNKEYFTCDCGNVWYTTKSNLSKSTKCKKCAKKITFEKLLTILNDVNLITNKDKWIKTSMTKNEYIKIKCCSDKCNNERVLKIKGIEKDSKLCKICSNKIMSNKMKAINFNENVFYEYEADAFKKISNFIIDEYIVKKTNNLNDKWMQIQIKSSKFQGRLYSFSIHDNIYDDMIVILYHLIDDKIWIIPGNNLPKIKKITIGKNKSIYDEYFVKSNYILNTINKYFDNINLKTEKEINNKINYLKINFLIKNGNANKNLKKISNIHQYSYIFKSLYLFN